MKSLSKGFNKRPLGVEPSTHHAYDTTHMLSKPLSISYLEKNPGQAIDHRAAVHSQTDFGVRSGSSLGTIAQADGLKARGEDAGVKKAVKYSDLVRQLRTPFTSSPSPIQFPSSVQADQFHLQPAIDKRVLSIASSLLDIRDKNRAFLRRATWVNICAQIANKDDNLQKE